MGANCKIAHLCPHTQCRGRSKVHDFLRIEKVTLIKVCVGVGHPVSWCRMITQPSKDRQRKATYNLQFWVKNNVLIFANYVIGSEQFHNKDICDSKANQSSLVLLGVVQYSLRYWHLYYFICIVVSLTPNKRSLMWLQVYHRLPLVIHNVLRGILGRINDNNNRLKLPIVYERWPILAPEKCWSS